MYATQKFYRSFTANSTDPRYLCDRINTQRVRLIFTREYVHCTYV